MLFDFRKASEAYSSHNLLLSRLHSEKVVTNERIKTAAERFKQLPGETVFLAQYVPKYHPKRTQIKHRRHKPN